VDTTIRMSSSISIETSIEPEGHDPESDRPPLLSNGITNTIVELPERMDSDAVDDSQTDDFVGCDEHQQRLQRHNDISSSTNSHPDKQRTIHPHTWMSVLGNSNKQQEIASTTPATPTTHTVPYTQQIHPQYQFQQSEPLIRCRSYTGSRLSTIVVSPVVQNEASSSSSSSSTTRQYRSDDLVSMSSSMIAVTATAGSNKNGKHRHGRNRNHQQSLAVQENLDKGLQEIADIDCSEFKESDSVKDDDETETIQQHPVWNEPLFVVSTIDEYEPKKDRLKRRSSSSSYQKPQQPQQYHKQNQHVTHSLVPSERILSMNVQHKHNEATDYMILNNKTTGNRTVPGRQNHHHQHLHQQRQQSVQNNSNHNPSRHPKLWSVADLMLFEEVAAMVTSGVQTTAVGNNDINPYVVREKEGVQQQQQELGKQHVVPHKHHEKQPIIPIRRMVPLREISIPSSCLGGIKNAVDDKQSATSIGTNTNAASVTCTSSTEYNNYNDNISVCTSWTLTSTDELLLLDKVDDSLKAEELVAIPTERVVDSIPVEVAVAESCSTSIRTVTSDYKRKEHIEDEGQRFEEEDVLDEDENEEEEDNSEYESKNICFDSIHEPLNARMLLSNLISSSRDIIGATITTMKGTDEINPAHSSTTATTTNTGASCAPSNNSNNSNTSIDCNPATATTTTSINPHRLMSITHNLRWGIMTATLDDK
jgi:hypothetical protein